MEHVTKPMHWDLLDDALIAINGIKTARDLETCFAYTQGLHVIVVGLREIEGGALASLVEDVGVNALEVALGALLPLPIPTGGNALA